MSRLLKDFNRSLYTLCPTITILSPRSLRSFAASSRILALDSASFVFDSSIFRGSRDVSTHLSNQSRTIFFEIVVALLFVSLKKKLTVSTFLLGECDFAFDDVVFFELFVLIFVQTCFERISSLDFIFLRFIKPASLIVGFAQVHTFSSPCIAA